MTTNNNLFWLSILLLFAGAASSRKTCDTVFFQFFVKVHSNCTIERLIPSDPVPPYFDEATQVDSSDVILHPKTNLSGRLYRPKNIKDGQRVPILVYFHGGGFVAGSTFNRNAQNQLFRISAAGNIIVLSVEYALVPEHKIPTPYRNGDKTLRWLAKQAAGKGDEEEKWLKDTVDFHRVFIGGQSSGANIAYNVAMRLQRKKRRRIDFGGLVMVDPYLLSATPLPSLLRIPEVFQRNITGLWSFACPKSIGPTDPRINPALETQLDLLNPGKVLICVAERDPMIDATKAFYNVLQKNVKKTELYETMSKGHAFDNIFPDDVEALKLYKKVGTFVGA